MSSFHTRVLFCWNGVTEFYDLRTDPGALRPLPAEGPEAEQLQEGCCTERRRHLRDRVVQEGLSVRALEQLGREAKGPAGKRSERPAVTVDPDIQRLTDQLRQRYQTSVKLHGNQRRGRIEIDFFGAEDLQRVSALLLGDA